MKRTFTAAAHRSLLSELCSDHKDQGNNVTGKIVRQPVHTVYGGAHIFTADISRKMGAIAERALNEFAGDARFFAAALSQSASARSAGSTSPLENDRWDTIYAKIQNKLRTEPVEDFRIDFEDGYGYRSDEEEDSHAVRVANELARSMSDGTLPYCIGIRIKPLTEGSAERALKTLDLVLTTLVSETHGSVPPNFSVTLPKVTTTREVETLRRALEILENELALPAGTIRIELMVETPQAIITTEGVTGLPGLVASSRGRCVAVHFGAYDYTAACGITSAHQHLQHPACDFARNVMQVSLAGSGVWLADGATNLLPVAPHRGAGITLTVAQQEENIQSVHNAWRLHYENIERALSNGFYQGWDLHPAQLPTRYAAVYSFFLGGIDQAAERLRHFVSVAARATLVGSVFDDAATGQGLLNFFTRATACGAISENEAVQISGLSISELRSASFEKILNNRRPENPNPDNEQFI